MDQGSSSKPIAVGKKKPLNGPKPKTKRPNYFFSLEITSEAIIKAISSLQERILADFPDMEDMRINLAKMHLTMFVLALESPEDVQKVMNALEGPVLDIVRKHFPESKPSFDTLAKPGPATVEATPSVEAHEKHAAEPRSSTDDVNEMISDVLDQVESQSQKHQKIEEPRQKDASVQTGTEEGDVILCRTREIVLADDDLAPNGVATQYEESDCFHEVAINEKMPVVALNQLSEFNRGRVVHVDPQRDKNIDRLSAFVNDILQFFKDDPDLSQYLTDKRPFNPHVTLFKKDWKRSRIKSQKEARTMRKADVAQVADVFCGQEHFMCFELVEMSKKGDDGYYKRHARVNFW